MITEHEIVVAERDRRFVNSLSDRLRKPYGRINVSRALLEIGRHVTRDMAPGDDMIEVWRVVAAGAAKCPTGRRSGR